MVRARIRHSGHTLAASVIVALTLCITARANRFQSYTEQYQNPTNPITIEAATYLGSEGSEWLSGGGFLSDGTIVVGGTSWGPTLAIAGKQADILGTDSPAPAPIELTIDKKGRKLLPGWRHPNGTPFLAWLTPGQTEVKKVVRLPWQTGPVTAIRIDTNDAIYIAGMTGPAFRDSVKAEEAVPDSTNAPSKAYILKMDSEGKNILWARTFSDAGKAVKLRILGEHILAEAACAYVFSRDGGLEDFSELPSPRNWRQAVNPLDLSYCLGYDRNTRTGHEPWRQPCLHIAPSRKEQEEGAWGRNLYRWDPKLVGSKKYRLVSDSSFTAMHYTDDGMLWAVGWSDGGNTVLRHHPLDLDAPFQFAGLGFSAWGAGCLSLAHIIKINPKNYELVNQTLWCGFLSGKDKPNSVRVTAISTATDESLLLSGTSAFGLIQTGNALHRHPDAPGGPYIAVLNKDLSSIRFSSSMVACGKVKIHDDGATWSIISQKVKGRHKVLFVGSAIEKEGVYAAPCPAPTLNALQESLAGGECDGYFAVMDLGPAL